jgi:predicted ArsR family transcriptional regulator
VVDVDRIERVLAGGPLTLRALAITLGQRQKAVWSALDRLRAEGRVVCERRSHDNGRPAVQWRLPRDAEAHRG